MIRQANLKDLKFIVDLEKKCFTNPFDNAFILNNFNSDITKYFVYVQNNNILGYIGIVLDEYVQVLNLCVLEEYRNQKIGTKLLTNAIEYCREKNLKYMTIDVRVSNVIAINIYKKLEFKVEYKRENYYSDNEDCYVMIRSI